MQKGGLVLKADVKQNVDVGDLDKILHFLALIFSRIFVCKSMFCKIIILNLTKSINVCTCK